VDKFAAGLHTQVAQDSLVLYSAELILTFQTADKFATQLADKSVQIYWYQIISPASRIFRTFGLVSGAVLACPIFIWNYLE
jgi:hypothetical protein